MTHLRENLHEHEYISLLVGFVTSEETCQLTWFDTTIFLYIIIPREKWEVILSGRGEEEERAPRPKRAERRRKKDLLSHLFTRIYINTTCFHHASCLDVVLINQTLWSEFSVVKHFALSTYVNEMVLLLLPIPQDPSVLAKLRCLFSFFFVRLCLFWTGFMTNVYHDGDRLLVVHSHELQPPALPRK